MSGLASADDALVVRSGSAESRWQEIGTVGAVSTHTGNAVQETFDGHSDAPAGILHPEPHHVDVARVVAFPASERTGK